MPERLHIEIAGAVQGVGFRPFVYLLARDLQVNGWVNNSPRGVTIEAEALPEQLNRFLEGIQHHAPPHAIIQRLESRFLPPVGYTEFEIRHSDSDGQRTAVILPDLAICSECLSELRDPANRRFQYPFINCTHCGPRFSIVTGLPYDRPNTTMRDFVMCAECQREYDNPLDRRFHAQPIACPICGPQLALWDPAGLCLAEKHDALIEAARAIRRGQIVALKGLGGFQLLVDARNQSAVRRLRVRKRRKAKPFAVMYPDFEVLRSDCVVTDEEKQLLSSAAAPIVLVVRRDDAEIANDVAPDNPYLGVMLPYTPLHHLLLKELGFAVVATSGNQTGEPICIDDNEALQRLNGIADLFLTHNRPIARPVDDSVVRVMAAHPVILRRARGYAPLPIQLGSSPDRILAVGAHQKNTIGIYDGHQAVLSQHIGDLDTPEALATFHRTMTDMQALYTLDPSLIVSDLHPDYYSSQIAEKSGLPGVRVGHHVAHVLACMAEHELTAPVLGVSWDGTGYGLDHTVWGGEFLRLDQTSFARVAHLKPFHLPGGERAVQEPRRSGLGLLYSVFGDNFPVDNACVQAFDPAALNLLRVALQKGINAPLTSSAGRLFDAVASLLGLQQNSTFEGQAAMMLEFCATPASAQTDECYPLLLTDSTTSQAGSDVSIDLKPMIVGLLDDMSADVNKSLIAVKFHNTLAEMITMIACRMNIEQVVLSGGCFQNKLLLEKSISRLERAGFRPFWHRQIPPNDGGIALGQISAVVRGYAHVSGSSG